jgi:hypothetical protein
MPSGPQWDLGRGGEQLIKRWLRRHGFYVLPAADIATVGAPAFDGPHEIVIVPDFLAARGGASRFVELKTKTRATFYRKGRSWQHGMRLAHWRAYQQVEELTGSPCFLAVLELESGLVLMQSIQHLGDVERVYDGNGMPDGKPHVFFPRDAFRWFDGPDGIDLDILPRLPPQSPRTLSQRSAPRVQQLRLPLRSLDAPVPAEWTMAEGLVDSVEV